MQDHAEPKSENWRILEQHIHAGAVADLESFLGALTPTQAALAISRLEEADRAKLLSMLDPHEAADLMSELPEVEAFDMFENLSAEQAAPIVEEMRSDHQADILGQLDDDDAEAILRAMPQTEAAEIRQLLTYAEDSAGGLMITEYLAYSEGAKVRDVLADLRSHAEEYADYDVQYAYVVAKKGQLLGVLRLRDLLLAPRDKPILDLMLPEPLKVGAETPLQELQEFFVEHSFFGVPVVDGKGKLIGVVRRASVREATNKSSNQTFLKVSGIVGGEEYRSMSFLPRSARRLSWLSINIVLNIIAASVIALYQETLEQAIVLAVFLPIISDMSGCSGNQAVAVSIRELTLGLVRPKELLRVLGKESSIGLFNGCVLGLLLATAAILWKGNPWLGVVVGGALAANTLLAVCLGGSIPLLLRGMKMDPALASGPILTTVTDMCGFFFVLSFATAVLPRLL